MNQNPSRAARKRGQARQALFLAVLLALIALPTTTTGATTTTTKTTTTKDTPTKDTQSTAHIKAVRLAVIPDGPDGPPAPASGWTTVFADGFNAPLGTKQGQDNLWYPSEPWAANTTTPATGNADETEAYKGSQVSVANSVLSLTALPDTNVVPTGVHGVAKNYLSGQVSTTFDGNKNTCAYQTSNCYKGWYWNPTPGPTWVFEIRAQMPVTTGEAFPAFWSSDANNQWTNERDFLEVHPDWLPSGYSTDLNYILDADWIYKTIPKQQDIYQVNVKQALGFDPSTSMHTYSYEIYPDASWSLYIDGVKQMWIGGTKGAGRAPIETSTNALQQLRINYALTANTFTTGTRSLKVDYVAVYEDTATASLPGHPYSSGQTLAPGTTLLNR